MDPPWESDRPVRGLDGGADRGKRLDDHVPGWLGHRFGCGSAPRNLIRLPPRRRRPRRDLSTRFLVHEARALLTRLARVKPLVLNESTVQAAALLPPALVAIERYLAAGRAELRALAHAYLRWLQGPRGRQASPAEAQRRFTFLRLRFNVVLTHFDVFNIVLTQRSENETGVWLSGLDTVSADALALPGGYYPPPVVCYLDRGVGAAIRRARTRLPGGGENPVAVIRVPRERMVGGGIASSLVHEVGHQAAALLDLVPSLRPVLQGLARGSRADRDVWTLWDRWISEIVADFWSVARIGVGSTLGLMAVVSLPRAFVFRLNVDDPHPVPWLRVKLSAAMGDALYPHPQWSRFAAMWESFYPPAGLDRARETLLRRLEATIPAFVALLVNHRPRSLRGHSLIEALDIRERQPARLVALYRNWLTAPWRMYRTAPSLVFAALGQARADGRLNARGREPAPHQAPHPLGDTEQPLRVRGPRRGDPIAAAITALCSQAECQSRRKSWTHDPHHDLRSPIGWATSRSGMPRSASSGTTSPEGGGAREGRAKPWGSGPRPTPSSGDLRSLSRPSRGIHRQSGQVQPTS